MCTESLHPPMNAEHEARQATSARTVLLVFGMNRPRIDSTLPALVARVQPTRPCLCPNAGPVCAQTIRPCLCPNSVEDAVRRKDSQHTTSIRNFVACWLEEVGFKIINQTVYMGAGCLGDTLLQILFLPTYTQGPWEEKNVLVRDLIWDPL